MLVATVAAGYLSGVLAFQFLNATAATPEEVLIEAAESANTHFLITAAIMALALAFALSSARALLLGLGINNPLRVVRGPIILASIGAVLTIILNLPGVFLVLVAGLAWGAYRIFDECFNPVQRRPITGAIPVAKFSPANTGGDLSDWS